VSPPPENGGQVNHDFNFSGDVKTRSTQSQNNDFQSKTNSNSSRRHRHSTSNSSKASTGSAPWESVTSPSSTPFTSPGILSPELNRQPSKPPYLPDDIDKEWLLVREEILSTPRETQEDTYGHIHPLVRKYAAHTIPELKLGEPRQANSIMARRWQLEETLQQEKRAAIARREEGGQLPSRPLTCLTKEQDKANRLAEQTLAMIKEMDTEKNEENEP
jgi:hypothetical protein